MTSDFLLLTSPFTQLLGKAWTDRVIINADKAMTSTATPPYSIRNSRHPGNPRDYFSEADYWWPDSSSNNRRKCIRRDGIVNPDNFFEHRKMLVLMCDAIASLAEGYYISNRTQYLQRIISVCSEWFVDPITSMTPHLIYGQVIPGEKMGRSYGIIDTVHLAEVAVNLHVLSASIGQTENIEMFCTICKWFESYLEWLLISPHGIEERMHKHNHAVSWALQVASLALLTKNRSARIDAMDCVNSNISKNIFSIGDVTLQTELRRTRPRNYYLFCTELLYLLDLILSVDSIETTYGFQSYKNALHTLYSNCAKLIASEPTGIKELDNSSEEAFCIESLALYGLLEQREDLLSTWREGSARALTFEETRNRPAKCLLGWLLALSMRKI